MQEIGQFEERVILTPNGVEKIWLLCSRKKLFLLTVSNKSISVWKILLKIFLKINGSTCLKKFVEKNLNQ